MVSRLRIRNAFATMVAVMVLGFTATVTPAQAGYYEEGTVRASLVVGTGVLGDERYFILGPGIGFFVLDGLEVEFDTELWFVGDPSLFVVSPGLRYTVTQLGEFMPYLGGFYKHAFIKGLDDQDSVGFRLGLSWDLAPNIMASGGAVFEYDLGCEASPQTQARCSRWLPGEFVIALLRHGHGAA